MGQLQPRVGHASFQEAVGRYGLSGLQVETQKIPVNALYPWCVSQVHASAAGVEGSKGPRMAEEGRPLPTALGTFGGAPTLGFGDGRAFAGGVGSSGLGTCRPYCFNTS